MRDNLVDWSLSMKTVKSAKESSFENLQKQLSLSLSFGEFYVKYLDKTVSIVYS